MPSVEQSQVDLDGLVVGNLSGKYCYESMTVVELWVVAVWPHSFVGFACYSSQIETDIVQVLLTRVENLHVSHCREPYVFYVYAILLA